MANRFLNAPTGEGGGLSISQLNTWFAGKDTDDLAQGVLNLYITPAEKAIITSLSTATTAPTPNTIAKRDSSGSSSFYNISAVGMYLRFDNTTEPSINMLDTQGADYSLLTDRNNNIPNLYLRNQNNSGHLHIQGRQQVILNTNNGANLQTASFNSSGLFIAPFITTGSLTSSGTLVSSSGLITTNISCGFINSLSGMVVQSNISAVKITTPDLIVNDNLISNGTAQFSRLTCVSGSITNITTSKIYPTISGGGLGIPELNIGQYDIVLSNNVYITTGWNGTLDMRADNMLFKGAGNTPQYATFDSSSVSFFRELITNSGITTQNISALSVNVNDLIKYSNSTGNKRLVLWDITNNDNEYFGLGLNSFSQRYQVPSSSSHDFYVATSSSTSDNILKVNGTGIVIPKTISGGIVNASGLLAKNLTIRGLSGIVNTSIGTDTDTLNINSFTNDTFYITTNLTTASGLAIGTANQHRLSLLTNNTERVRITGNSGFVGINESSPQYQLDVNGTARITGVITANEFVASNNKPFWSYWSNTITTTTGALTFLSSNSGSNFKNISGTPDTNGRANISISGYYDVSFDAWVSDPVPVGGYTDVYMRVNGGNMDQFRSYFTSAVGNYPGCIVMRGIRYFNKGDYLDVNLANGILHSQGQRFTGVFVST